MYNINTWLYSQPLSKLFWDIITTSTKQLFCHLLIRNGRWVSWRRIQTRGHYCPLQQSHRRLPTSTTYCPLCRNTSWLSASTARMSRWWGHSLKVEKNTKFHQTLQNVHTFWGFKEGVYQKMCTSFVLCSHTQWVKAVAFSWPVTVIQNVTLFLCAVCTGSDSGEAPAAAPAVVATCVHWDHQAGHLHHQQPGRKSRLP